MLKSIADFISTFVRSEKGSSLWSLPRQKALISLLIGSSLALSSCANETNSLSPQEITESIKVGEGVEQSLPYDLPIYPGAKIKASMLGGLTVLMETDASPEDVANFYFSELESRGLAPEGPAQAGQHIRVSAKWDSHSSETLEILVRDELQARMIVIGIAKIKT